MKDKLTVTFLPSHNKVTVRPGTTVLRAAQLAGVTIRTRCSGVMGCLMCKVTTDGTGITAPQANERYKLGDVVENGTRLACQATIVGQATIEVPEDPLKAAIRRQLLQNQIDDPF